MRIVEAYVVSLRQGEAGLRQAEVSCPAEMRPAAGQYLLAWGDDPGLEPLATPLFQVEVTAQGFLAAPPVPSTWLPGTRLHLRGPLGRGFSLPLAVRRLALAAFDVTPARLLPVARLALARGCDVVLYSLGLASRGLEATLLPTDLPLSLEIYPLDSLAETFSWADFMALDLPLEALPRLRARLGLPASAGLPCPAQALIVTPMPCGGLGECGACAVPARRTAASRRGWKLTCLDGPVFDLNDLDW